MMTEEKLREQVKKKANREVRAAVRVFRKAIIEACYVLLDRGSSFGAALDNDCVEVLEALISGNNLWPTKLWLKREKRLLWMQKGLLAKGDCVDESMPSDEKGE